MKAMLHGLPVPFVTEVGIVFNWNNESEYEVYQCDPIGDNPNGQLKNVYLRRVKP